MISYKNIIFSLFGYQDKVLDVLKDVNGKGTFERFNEVVGKDIDDNLKPFIDNLAANLIVPNTIDPDYLQFAELDLGVTLNLGTATARRRTVLKYVEVWKQIRTTKKCVKLLFALLGITCVITEIFATSRGFDSPLTLDDPDRVFDGGCAGCSKTTIALTGTAPLTRILKNIFESIINWNIPLTTQLTGMTYSVHVVSSLAIATQGNDIFSGLNSFFFSFEGEIVQADSITFDYFLASNPVDPPVHYHVVSTALVGWDLHTLVTDLYNKTFALTPDYLWHYTDVDGNEGLRIVGWQTPTYTLAITNHTGTTVTALSISAPQRSNDYLYKIR